MPNLPVPPTSTLQALSGGIIFAWLIAEAVVHYRSGARGSQITLPAALVRSAIKGSTGEDRGSGVIILVAFYAWAVGMFAGISFGLPPLPWYAFYVGLAVSVAGILVRLWAVAVLGRNFSLIVKTSPDQTIVRDGPYRYVRHPSYTGLLLIGVGVPAVLLSPIGLLLGLLVLPGAIAYRVRVEERALVRRFGEAYTNYRRSTWRVIPFLV
jgi:protein-S-isoprenylcysteine O-methyltransferase Ste14